MTLPDGRALLAVVAIASGCLRDGETDLLVEKRGP